MPHIIKDIFLEHIVTVYHILTSMYIAHKREKGETDDEYNAYLHLITWKVSS